MRIGIDFDRTIFDTDGFKQKLEEDFPGFSESYRDAKKNGVYRPGEHAERLGVDLQELFDGFRQAEAFIYDDTDVLARYQDSGIKLFLVSRGDKEFQRIKIKSTGVSELFDRTAIISRPIEEAPKDSVIDMDLMVDDRREELEALDIPGVLVDPDRKDVRKVVEAIEKGKELET